MRKHFIIDGKEIDLQKWTRRWEDLVSETVTEMEAKKIVYTYTQRVSDQIRDAGYSGILYPSAQVPGKSCIVVFEDALDRSNFSELFDLPIN